MEARSGVIRGQQTRRHDELSTCRKSGGRKQSRLEIRYSPTLAGAMVDALPYLVDYPYGCTEQTLNRFLPTVITQKVLLDMKLNLAEIRKKRTNLNAQEIGDDTERARQWKRYDRNPVFDEDEVRRMVKDGINRLTEMQLSDGGWGWFSGFGEHSSPHTTALVVHGLQVAKSNDVALVPGMLEKGVEWLRRYQDEQVQWLKNAAIEKKPDGLRWKEHADEQDAFDYMILVAAGVKNAEMRDFLYRDRTKIAVYGLAMYGIALQQEGEKEKLGHGHAEHQSIRAAGQREPDRLAQSAGRLLVVLVRQRVRGRGLLPEAPLAQRSQGRAGLAAGQVPAQQPQERHLLELDPRHGDRGRGHGRVHQGQRRVAAGDDRRGLLRRQAAEGRGNHAADDLLLR